jgi:hypothetical protein
LWNFKLSAEVKWAVVGASGGPNALDADQDISSCAQAPDSQKPSNPTNFAFKMDPTPAELEGMDNLTTIMEWAGFADDAARQSFIDHLGLQVHQHPRVLGAMPEAQYQETMAGWKVTKEGVESDPSPLLRTIAALVGRAARIKVGSQKTIAQLEEEVKTQTAKEEARRVETMEFAKLQTTQACATKADVNALEIRLSTIINQTSDVSVQVVDQSVIKKAYAAYKQLFKRYPTGDEELNTEQFSGLHHLLFVSGGSPYVDLSIWTPHAIRLVRKIKLTGLQIMPGGEMRSVEFFGPPSYEVWDKCYTLLQTGMVMFDQVDLGNLMIYLDKVKGYSDRYGAGVWHLIYQCEVRTRLEHFERIRRQGQDLLADALLVNPALDKSTFSFQEDRPWN